MGEIIRHNAPSVETEVIEPLYNHAFAIFEYTRVRACRQVN